MCPKNGNSHEEAVKARIFKVNCISCQTGRHTENYRKELLEYEICSQVNSAISSLKVSLGNPGIASYLFYPSC